MVAGTGDPFVVRDDRELRHAHVAGGHLVGGEHQSLCFNLDSNQIGARSIGGKGASRGELIEIDGRKLRIHVLARDEQDLIGEGRHDRFVVPAARFIDRISMNSGA